MMGWEIEFGTCENTQRRRFTDLNWSKKVQILHSDCTYELRIGDSDSGMMINNGKMFVTKIQFNFRSF